MQSNGTIERCAFQFRHRPIIVTAERMTDFRMVRCRPSRRSVWVDGDGICDTVCAEPGDWITSDANGRESVWSDQEFHERFESAE